MAHHQLEMIAGQTILRAAPQGFPVRGGPCLRHVSDTRIPSKVSFA
jgi:hypothetical protein